MQFKQVIYTVTENVATITLNRPERLNALSAQLRLDLKNALEVADTSNEVRAIIITGAGRGFCSGGDVKAMNEANESGTAGPLNDKIAPVRDQVVLAMRNASKPVIAAVNGPAAGAGMNIRWRATSALRRIPRVLDNRSHAAACTRIGGVPTFFRELSGWRKPLSSSGREK